MGLTKPRAYQIYDLDYKQSVRVVTDSNITLVGGASSTVDGVALSLNDRVLVTGQSTGSQNGLYIVTTVGTGANGTWQRSIDTNETGELDSGTIVMVTEGLIYADTQWKLITNDPIVIGATALTFIQNYSANSISAGTSNVVVRSNANVTVSSAGVANVLIVTSTGANVTGTLGVTGNITGGNLSGTGITGTLLTGAQTNITSVGTLGSLTVTANVAGGNLTTAGQIVATGNVSGGNLNITGNIVDSGAFSLITAASGNINLAPNGTNTVIATTTGANVTGTLTATGNVSGGNITTAGQVTAVGNISGSFFIGNGSLLTGIAGGGGTPTAIVNGTSNVSIGSSGGNVTTSVGGTANVLIVTATSANVTGTLGVTGNISGNFFIGNGSALTGIATGGVRFTSVANTAPAGANNGDFWFNTFTDILYQYIDDGTSDQWIDQSFPTSFSSISVGNITNSNANGVGNIGSATTFFNTVFAKATSAQYADLAEMYEADGYYPPGHVVVFGGDKEITLSTQSHDTAVAGIISTNPSYLMNSTQSGEWVLAVALTGRVPCLVQGPVKKGDVLATSSKPGTAQRIGVNWQPGCVIGKSLENISDDSVQVIEVAVGRF